MGDQNQRGALLAVKREHQRHDGLSGGEVQAARGFVRKEHRRLHHECPRQRHPLLFASTQYLGIGLQALGQTDPLEHGGSGLTRIFAARQFQREHDVFERREVAQQLKTLKYEANAACTQSGASVFVQGKQVFAANLYRAAAGRIQTRDDGEQGTFTRSRGADNGHRLAPVEREIDILEDVQRTSGIGYRLADLLNRDN